MRGHWRLFRVHARTSFSEYSELATMWRSFCVSAWNSRLTAALLPVDSVAASMLAHRRAIAAAGRTKEMAGRCDREQNTFAIPGRP